jgi:hypothetical protein
MNPLFAAAAEIQQLCLERDWRFCFIGGLAVLRWGEPRLTRDVDLTILAGHGSEAPAVDVLLDRFEPRIDDARAFAVANRVVLVHASNGVPLDIALGALEFEERAAERASAWSVGDVSLRTCSAEDLVVHKVFAGRDQDWLDVAGIIVRQGAALDTELTLSEALPLLELKGSLEDIDRLRAALGARDS